jgi:membrane-anchored protein YejM (alkaline phosphatase superfamily)
MSQGSSGSSGARNVDAVSAQGVANAPFDPALFERVVRQTLALAEDQDAETSADLQKLRVIAHRRKGQHLMLEPVVVEMVMAMLGASFAGLDADPQRYREIAMKIARTLLEDPVASKRMENLWVRLAEIG